jgi:hypothetical protein
MTRTVLQFMMSAADSVQWLVPALVGATFTSLGLLKLYGLSKGTVGGRCGTAPRPG